MYPVLCLASLRMPLSRVIASSPGASHATIFMGALEDSAAAAEVVAGAAGAVVATIWASGAWDTPVAVAVAMVGAWAWPSLNSVTGAMVVWSWIWPSVIWLATGIRTLVCMPTWIWPSVIMETEAWVI